MSIELKLSSGYTVTVTSLTPYYMDVLDALFPLQDLPKRAIELAFTDDTVYVTYEPPSQCPDVNVDPQGHDLYYRYKAALSSNSDTLKKRDSYRVDLLLSMCVTVTHYPEHHSDDWMKRIALPFGVEIEFENEYLSLLKYVVITTQDDRDVVLQAATYVEVTHAGISVALSKFDVLWDSEDLTTLMNAETEGMLSHTVRLYEARMARDMGIPFDEQWYRIPVIAREYMIASRMADNIISNLSNKSARKVKI